MRLNPLLLFAASASLLAAGPALAQAQDEAGVRQALDHYLAGQASGDPAQFRAAFHDDFKMFLVRNGQVVQRTDEEYIAGASGKPADDEAKRKRSIESISITGNVAIAKIVLDYPGTLFTDYMSLVRTADGWKIITKLVDVQPRPKPAAQ